MKNNIEKGKDANLPAQPYCPASEVEAMAKELIREYHPHLQEASIAYLFRTGSWKNRGQVVTGKALAAPQMWRHISSYDLVLIVNQTIWANLERKGQRALLDHELSRFTAPKKDRAGNLRWELQEQDLKEFSQVIKRHGICIGNPQTLMELAGKMDLKALEESAKEQFGESLGGEGEKSSADDEFLEEETIDSDDTGIREGEAVIQNIFENEPFG